MPITGKFEADFTAFSASVEQATQQLVDFGKTAATLNERISTMGEGGEHLKRVSEEARKANNTLADLKATVTSLAAAFGVGFSVQQILSFVGGLTEGARALRNLSNETGISTTQLQLMGAAFGDLGVTMDDIGKVINQLSLRLAGGDQSAAGAIHALGLSLEDLQGQTREEIFRTLLQALDRIPNEMQKASTAADLFGAKVGGAAVKMAKDYDQAIEQARKFNNVISEEAIQAAARNAEIMDQATTNAKNLATEGLAPVLEQFNAIYETWQQAPSKVAALKSTLIDLYALMKGFSTPDLTRGIGGVPTTSAPGSPTGDYGPATPPKAPSSDQIMYAIMTDQLKALTAEQEHYLEQLYDMDKLTKENAAAFGVSAEQMEAFRKKEEDTIATQARLSDQMRDMKEIQAKLLTDGIEKTDKLNDKEQKRRDNLDAITTALRTQSVIAEDAAKKSLAERSLGPGQNDPVAAAMDALNAEIKRLDDILAKTGEYNPAQRAQAYANLDDVLFGRPRSGTGGLMGGAPSTAPVVQVQVSGVLDPRTINELAAAVGNAMMDTGRKWSAY